MFDLRERHGVMIVVSVMDASESVGRVEVGPDSPQVARRSRFGSVVRDQMASCHASTTRSPILGGPTRTWSATGAAHTPPTTSSSPLTTGWNWPTPTRRAASHAPPAHGRRLGLVQVTTTTA
jgi:hypothetical protein